MILSTYLKNTRIFMTYKEFTYRPLEISNIELSLEFKLMKP